MCNRYNDDNNSQFKEIYNILQEIGDNDWIKYFKNFQNEDVRDDDAKYLDEDELQELIPKIGPQIRFKKIWSFLFE